MPAEKSQLISIDLRCVSDLIDQERTPGFTEHELEEHNLKLGQPSSATMTFNETA